MAAGKYQESYSSRFSNCEYQVFLSFRGEDTRKNFTDHLYWALVQAGFHTFRDDDEIRRGENIELELQKAIQESKISIIVFSKDYARSRWCLDELVKIMEHKRTAGSIVLPVFYHVNPSEVRNQTGSFAAAFVEQEKRFKEEIERVKGWRIALKEVADLAGMDLRDGYEARFVQSIVENVSKILDPKIFDVPLHFIGRDALVQAINSWLQDGSHGAAIALLYGIGGVGKTAIAKSVFNQNYYKFEGKSFLSNFRSKNIVCLQRQLLSDILKKTVDEINDEDEGILKIKNALCCRRTLIVLDDVGKRDQFNKIIGMQSWLCKGSKIIVTTRNRGLFSANDIEWFERRVDPLDDEKSLELFSWNAFGQADPVDGFVENSGRIVRHCNGLPLALGVIGSSLSGKGRKIWESALQQLEASLDIEVQKVLRISYDFLDGDCLKNFFLDIACFFNGLDVDDAVRILDGLYKGAISAIDKLIDRCLVEINNDKRLWMHQLVRAMGREIAHQESHKCQRIWRHEDAFTVLKGDVDAEKLRGLTIDMHALMKDNNAADSMVRQKHSKLNFFPQLLSDFSNRGKLQKSLFPADAFRKMTDVKFLQLNYTNFHGSLEHFPKNLIWLCWHGLSSRSIPNHVCLEKLVVLDLSRSCLVDAWKGKLFLPKLKVLDLRHSRDLIRTPDFSGLLALEKLILEDCIRLVQIHNSIGDLQRLLILNLRNCSSLMELPEEMSRLNSLQELVLDGCSNLDILNMELEYHQGRSLLQSDGIVASASYITSLPLKLFFPSRFSARKMLRFTLFALPRFLGSLNLSGTPIRFLPESIKDLGLLRALYLSNCKMLEALPELPSHLEALDVSYCYSLQSLANRHRWIGAYGCDHLVEFQDWIKQELIQKFDSHMFRIIETVVKAQIFDKSDSPIVRLIETFLNPQILDYRKVGFQIVFTDGTLSVHVFNKDEESPYMYAVEKEDKWLIQNEFVGNFPFKISLPPAHRICGFNLFARYSATSRYRRSYVHLEIRNNTRDQSLRRQAFVFGLSSTEYQSLSHFKLMVNDLTLYDGDDVSISVLPHDPDIQIKTIGVRWLHEEEGKDDDFIQSNDEVINAHNSSDDDAAHVSKVEIASHLHNSSSDDDDDDDDDDAHVSNSSDDAHAAKVEIASLIFRNYYCCNLLLNDGDFSWWQFRDRGL